MNKENKIKIGYTTGVFDLFHIGHLNLLRNAKSMCDKLIVGVTTDELVKYKGKIPIISLEDRMEIVRAIKYVDVVIPQERLCKIEAKQKIKFDILFVGDDWYNKSIWIKYERKLKQLGVQVIYLPYTKRTSSTIISNTLEALRKKEKQEGK